MGVTKISFVSFFLTNDKNIEGISRCQTT